MGNLYGSPRIWYKNEEYPGLMMSRSLGDRFSHKLGVIAEPDVRLLTLDATVKYILMGSDGLWEFISFQRALKTFINHKSDLDVCVKKLYKKS